MKGSAQLGRRAIPNEQLVATAAVIPRGIIVVRRHDCAVIVLLRISVPRPSEQPAAPVRHERLSPPIGHSDGQNAL